MNDLSTPPPRRPDARVIAIRGAREHNLKNIDVEIPRDRLVVFTGLSGLRQVLACLRHDLRRGPAPLCRIALGLCPPVPGNDAEAGRGPDRRAVAGDFDRAEDHLEKPALDRRHRHRDLRLYAAPVGAHRRALLAGDRPADRKPNRLADGRSHHGAAGRHASLPAGAARARTQGRVQERARRVDETWFPTGKDRRRVLRDRRRARARQEAQPRHRRGGRPPGRPPRYRDPPRRIAGDRPQARRRARRGGACGRATLLPFHGHLSPRAGRGRPRSESGEGQSRASRGAEKPTSPAPTLSPPAGRGSRSPGERRKRRKSTTSKAGRSACCSRRNSPARCRASPSPKSSRGCSRSTARMARARPAAASASSRRSMPSWWCPTRR